MTNHIRTTLWHEEPEPNDPFATHTARCRGYNVYGDLVGTASWAEMLLLLWRGERPDPSATRLLEALAVALANAGPTRRCRARRDVRRSGRLARRRQLDGRIGRGCRPTRRRAGRGPRSALVAQARHRPRRVAARTQRAGGRDQIHLAADRPCTGFDAHASACAGTTVQALAALARLGGAHLTWLAAQRSALELAAGAPLAMSGVAAAALADLGLSPEAGEMLYLLLRLPGAAAHALEQRLAFKRFPLLQPRDRGRRCCRQA